jgi:hypothetical protein
MTPAETATLRDLLTVHVDGGRVYDKPWCRCGWKGADGTHWADHLLDLLAAGTELPNETTPRP